jgi:hypothetical protein
MRPISNSREYFENLNNYLASIVYTDSIDLKNSGLANDNYYLLTDYGIEPQSSFIQDIKTEVSDKIIYYMSASSDQIPLFKEYNPICEGFVITDIEITSYQSQENQNHFFHKILFSAFNTTRYNTVSFKAEAYQDISPIMDDWNNNINNVMNSKNTDNNKILPHSDVYVSLITVLNNATCITGQESECQLKGYNINSSFSQLLNDKFLDDPKGIQWKQPNVITQNTYTSDGTYDENGNIQITDFGPDNLDQLIAKINNAN